MLHREVLKHSSFMKYFKVRRISHQAFLKLEELGIPSVTFLFICNAYLRRSLSTMVPLNQLEFG